GAMREVGSGRGGLHADASPASVAFHIGAEIVTEQIVAAILLLDFWKGFAQISQIEECAAASVGGKGRKGVARILPRFRLVKHGCAREHGGAGGGVCGGIAARSFRKEASSVDRIDRDIGTIRCVGCCPQ